MKATVHSEGHDGVNPEEHRLWVDDGEEVYLLTRSNGCWRATALCFDDPNMAWNGEQPTAADAVDGLRPFFGSITLTEERPHE